MSLRRLLPFLVGIPAAAALFACQDAYAPKALESVVQDTVALRALSGTPITASSGLWLRFVAPATPGATENFDFALDLDANNKVVILPKTKVLTCLGPCQLGIQLVATRFDSLYDAPSRGYVYDSTRTVSPGQTVVLVTKEPGCLPSNIATYDMYAKMVVDSVRPSDRTIFIRVASDPNCGFRGLVPGVIPKH